MPWATTKSQVGREKERRLRRGERRDPELFLYWDQRWEHLSGPHAICTPFREKLQLTNMKSIFSFGIPNSPGHQIPLCGCSCLSGHGSGPPWRTNIQITVVCITCGYPGPHTCTVSHVFRLALFFRSTSLGGKKGNDDS